MLHWILMAAVVLAASLAAGLTFLAYAMEALLLLLVASRVLARQWIESLSAERETSRLVADVGDTVSVVIRIRNRGLLPIPWCLVEDLLPRSALLFDPPNLGQKGRRTKLLMLAPHSTAELRYELTCTLAATTSSGRRCWRPATCLDCTVATGWRQLRTS